jgi:hypothetical protein
LGEAGRFFTLLPLPLLLLRARASPETDQRAEQRSGSNAQLCSHCRHGTSGDATGIDIGWKTTELTGPASRQTRDDEGIGDIVGRVSQKQRGRHHQSETLNRSSRLAFVLAKV